MRSMALARKLGMTVQLMMVNGNKERKKEKAHSPNQITVFTKESSRVTIFMVKASSHGMMVGFIKDSGPTMSFMAKGSLLGLMAAFIKGPTKMIRNMGMVCSN